MVRVQSPRQHELTALYINNAIPAADANQCVDEYRGIGNAHTMPASV